MPYGRGYVVSEDATYPSITTVLGALSKEHLDEWRKQVGDEVADDISRRAAEKGTAVHELCENYINGSEIILSNYSPLEQTSFLKIKEVLDKKVDKIVCQEVALFSDKHKVAGRVDLIAEYDNILSIIDFKTSNSPKQKDWIKNYFIQETAYCLMFYEMTGILIKQIVTIITVDFDEPQIFIENPMDYYQDFLAARENFKQKHGI